MYVWHLVLSSLNKFAVREASIGRALGVITRCIIVVHFCFVVGFTVCVHAYAAEIAKGSPILFDTVRSNYGVDVSSLKTSGNFTCTKPGLYLISATIRSKTNAAYFAVYKKNTAIVYGYTAEHEKTDTFQHSGTIQCVKSFGQGDVISVKPWKTIEVNKWSCLTVVMVK
ncbi:unnamed protein product [Mytilus coruscus]|uniref:C1q domain-containing protein n=1 Tax=Mytilus coruscus TaxID=42192 RepID=A0A6J8D2B3_MYTCO|nr:unnamed protein product [Mytilus coruscus]